MPEYRTEPELDRGYAAFAIRSTLFRKNDRNALPVAIAYWCSSDVDVAVDFAQDKSTGEYAVTKYVRCTDKSSCYRAILDLDKKLKKMERSKHALRCTDGRLVFYELTHDDLKDMRKFLKHGSEPNAPPPPSKQNDTIRATGDFTTPTYHPYTHSLLQHPMQRAIPRPA